METKNYKYRGYYCINNNTRNIKPFLYNNLNKLCSNLYKICKAYNASNYHWYVTDKDNNNIAGGQQVCNSYHRLTKQELIEFC